MVQAFLRKTTKHGNARSVDVQLFPVPVRRDCPYGCGGLFFHEWEFVRDGRSRHDVTPCCRNGTRMLHTEAVTPPVFLVQFVEEQKILTGDPRFFCKHDRELNQMVSAGIVGVETLPLAKNKPPQAHGAAVFQRYEASMVTMNGKSMMFKSRADVATLNKRTHPLCGAGLIYLFAEPGNKDPIDDYFMKSVPGTVREGFCEHAVLLAARTLRPILLQHNSLIQWTKSAHGITHVNGISGERFIAVFDEMVNQGGAANQGQLMCLRKNNGNIMETPMTFMQVVNELSQVVYEFPPNSQFYHQLAFPLLDPTCRQGWDIVMKEGSTWLAPFRCTFNTYIDLWAYQATWHWRTFPRLCQEWILDALSRRDAMNDRQEVLARLAHREHNARAFRVTTVRELTDSDTWFDTGQLRQLPDTKRGSPAHKEKRVEQGMGHVRADGRPQIFVTMTANKDSPTVGSNLAGTENEWYENPWLMNAIFNKDFEDLSNDLLHGHSLFPGMPAQYFQAVIEFQLRGQPHAHCLVRLPNLDFDVPETVDKYVSCAIPKGDEELAGLVRKYMVHKCYPGRCYKDLDKIDERTGKPVCHYKFPKRITAETHRNDKDGYWHLKRRAGEEWVVSYNPEMLRRFKCHINVEPVANDASIMYLQKYIRKSVDTAKVKLAKNPRNMTLQEQYDCFHLARSMTSSEACWTVQGFPFSGMIPAVTIIPCQTSKGSSSARQRTRRCSKRVTAG